MTKYLFIDRDGTLIEEPPDHQIDSIEKFKLVPGVLRALQDLVRAGHRLVMITNQDALGSQLNPSHKFEMIQTLLLDILSTQGVTFDEVLVCPHAESDHCECRKPKTQLVRKYLASNEMDRARSFVIGDRPSDVELAKNMGLKSFRIGETTWPIIADSILNEPRVARERRRTNETDIDVEVRLDGRKKNAISTGIGFFDHMLEQLASHGKFDLKLKAIGDLHIDDHHVIEDVALAIGTALRTALGDKRGIGRYGFWIPMDESSTRVTLDLSGRPQFVFKAPLVREQISGLALEMIPHFFKSLSDSLAMSLHIETTGDNHHHMVESMFKAVGRALAPALAKSAGEHVPSTKGSL